MSTRPRLLVTSRIGHADDRGEDAEVGVFAAVVDERLDADHAPAGIEAPVEHGPGLQLVEVGVGHARGAGMSLPARDPTGPTGTEGTTAAPATTAMVKRRRLRSAGGPRLQTQRRRGDGVAVEVVGAAPQRQSGRPAAAGPGRCPFAEAVAVSRGSGSRSDRRPEPPFGPVVDAQHLLVGVDHERGRRRRDAGPVLGGADQRVLLDGEVVKGERPPGHPFGARIGSGWPWNESRSVVKISARLATGETFSSQRFMSALHISSSPPYSGRQSSFR